MFGHCDTLRTNLNDHFHTPNSNYQLWAPTIISCDQLWQPIMSSDNHLNDNFSDHFRKPTSTTNFEPSTTTFRRPILSSDNHLDDNFNDYFRATNFNNQFWALDDHLPTTNSTNPLRGTNYENWLWALASIFGNNFDDHFRATYSND